MVVYNEESNGIQVFHYYYYYKFCSSFSSRKVPFFVTYILALCIHLLALHRQQLYYHTAGDHEQPAEDDIPRGNRMESKGELINSLAKKYRVPVLLDAEEEEEKKWLATGILFPPLDL